MRNPKLLGIAFLLLAIRAQAQYVIVPSCGTENSPSCSTSDSEYYDINYFVGKACDWGLKAENGICVNDTRRTIAPGWVQWAMDEQRYGINADSPINQVTTFGTHNSFSSYNGGVLNALAADQTLSITDQLQAGARSIRIDGVFYGKNMRVCHGPGNEDSSTAAACQLLSAPFSPVPWSPGRLVAFAFDEVKRWLNDNPKQFIVLQMNGGWLNGDSGTQLMVNLIETYFGPILVTGNDVISGGVYTWDSISHYQRMGKQIVILSFPQLSDGSDNIIAFSKSNLLIDFSSQTPDQITSCAKGQASTVHVDPKIWTEFGEDRSGSAAFPGAGFIGYVDESYVELAAVCGVSLINVDFLDARKDTFPPTFSVTPEPSYASPDLRPDSTVWTFNRGDFGRRGPVIMTSNGRWSSDIFTASHLYACEASNDTNLWRSRPVWVVSSMSGPWANGTTMCPSGYRFGFPKNPQQNADLTTVANGRTLWLNYQTSGATSMTVSPGTLVFNMQAGGPIPDAQHVTVTEWVAGTKVTITKPSGATWLNVADSVTVPNSQTVDVPISINHSATGLHNAEYFANLTFTAPNATGGSSTATVQVHLNVKEPTTVAFAATPNPAGEGNPVTFTAIVTSQNASGLSYSSTVELRETTPDPATGSPVVTTLASSPVGAGSPAGTIAHFALGQLANGVHKLTAVYLGNNVFQRGASATLTETVTAFLQASPASISKSFSAGSPPTGVIATAGFTWLVGNQSTSIQTSCNGQQPCSWLRVAALNPNSHAISATLQYGPGAASLAVGQYQALVTISDTIHQSTSAVFNLSVLGTLTAAPVTLKLVASTQRVSAAVHLGVPSGSIEVLPHVTTSSGGNWLKAAGSQAPGSLAVEANPAGLRPGTYNGTVTLTSTLASNTPAIPVQLVVVPPSVVDSSPSGLQIRVDNVPYTTPATFAWLPGEQHTLSAQATFTLDGTEHKFRAWRPGGTSPDLTIHAPSNNNPETWTADFTILYHLEADPVPTGGGTIQLSPAPQPGGYYAAGIHVQVTAVPAAGYTFAGFSGAVSGTQNPQTVVMSGVRQLTATFQPPPQ